VLTRYTRQMVDHFEPEAILDPQAQRRLRGILEKIDYTAFASNREVLGATLHTLEEERLQHLAVAAAQARGRWVTAALAVAERDTAPTADDVERLAVLRAAYEEFAGAYEALRRMVERGYVTLTTSAPRKASKTAS
jgi:hypothetical protein